MKKLLTAAIFSTTLISLVSSGSARAAGFGYLGTSDGRIGTINLSTGQFSSFVDTTLNNTLGDIAVSENGTIYANSLSSTGGNNFLYTVNSGTSALTPLGDTNINNVAGLAFDTSTNQLYGSSFAQGSTPGSFLSLNTSTGVGSSIANIPNFSAAGDIAYNPTTKTFFGTSTTPNNSTLFAIALDGTAQQIGNIGFQNVYGLIYDSGTLYGFTKEGKQLTIDLSTGVGTFQKDVTGMSSGASILGASAAAVPEPLTIAGYLTAVSLGAGLKRKFKFKNS